MCDHVSQQAGPQSVGAALSETSQKEDGCKRAHVRTRGTNQTRGRSTSNPGQAQGRRERERRPRGFGQGLEVRVQGRREDARGLHERIC